MCDLNYHSTIESLSFLRYNTVPIDEINITEDFNLQIRYQFCFRDMFLHLIYSVFTSRPYMEFLVIASVGFIVSRNNLISSG
jgi:hypothetical protein